MTRSLLALVLAVAVSGCGGGTGPVAAVPQTAANAGSSIESTIVVPGASETQSGQRSPQYVSASTLGLKVTVTDVPPTRGMASFTAITSVYALGIGLNKIIIPTPASAAGHAEDLTYVAYNLAPAANAIPGNAKALAYGITTGFVVAPGQNTNNVSLSAVVDGFPLPLSQSGAFGMMSAAPPTLAGVQTSLGFGGAAVPSGTATLIDGGGNNITTAAGGPWPVVGAVPASATTVGTGVPLTIAESAGVCGAVGAGPHLKLSTNGGAPATTAAISRTTDTIQAVYDGNGGVGWSAIVTAKAQSQNLTYTISSFGVNAVPSGNAADWSCANQTFSFSGSNETALMTISEHAPAAPYSVTVPNTAACSQLVNVYIGPSTAPANLIPYGVATSLGAASSFTVQLQAIPGGPTTCVITVQDANAAVTGGTLFPGATTYVAATLPPTTYSIIVP